MTFLRLELNGYFGHDTIYLSYWLRRYLRLSELILPYRGLYKKTDIVVARDEQKTILSSNSYRPMVSPLCDYSSHDIEWIK